eukprot:48617-Eustigmatos_ZCMA.PRE.1
MCCSANIGDSVVGPLETQIPIPAYIGRSAPACRIEDEAESLCFFYGWHVMCAELGKGLL